MPPTLQNMLYLIDKVHSLLWFSSTQYIYNTEIDQASVYKRIEDCLRNGKSNVVCLLIRRTSVTSTPAALVTIRILNVITFKGMWRTREKINANVNFHVCLFLFTGTVSKCYGLQNCFTSFSWFGLPDKEKRIKKSTAYLKFIFKEFIDCYIAILNFYANYLCALRKRKKCRPFPLNVRGVAWQALQWLVMIFYLLITCNFMMHYHRTIKW